MIKKVSVDARWDSKERCHTGWIIISFEGYSVAYKVSEALITDQQVSFELKGQPLDVGQDHD